MPNSENLTANSLPRRKRHWGHLIAMALITIFAVALMIASVSKGRGEIEEGEIVNLDARPASVRLQHVEQSIVEISDRYSGTIRPFERFTFGFENSGRVIELGENDRQQPLDEGDTVFAGQQLAYLDTEALVAVQEELNVALEYAEEEYQRALDLQEENYRAINDAEVLKRNKERLVALAKKKSLEKQLKDATLRTTVDGVISKRIINAGEIATMQSPAFEVIQVDRLLLVVGVPESRIQRIPRQNGDGSADNARVYIRLIGSGDFGSAKPKPILGTVFRIGQTADEQSGMFEVEILLDNADGMLRPGMIAIADIVVNKVEGFQIPLSATVVREDRMYLFAAVANGEKVRTAAKTEGEPDIRESNTHAVARRFELERNNYEIQEESVIVRELPEPFRNVVTSGQHRLVEGRSLLEVDEPTTEQNRSIDQVTEPSTAAKQVKTEISLVE